MVASPLAATVVTGNGKSLERTIGCKMLTDRLKSFQSVLRGYRYRLELLRINYGVTDIKEEGLSVRICLGDF